MQNLNYGVICRQLNLHFNSCNIGPGRKTTSVASFRGNFILSKLPNREPVATKFTYYHSGTKRRGAKT